MTNLVTAPSTYSPGATFTHADKTVRITRIVPGGYMAARDDVSQESFVTDAMLENFLATGSLILLHQHEYTVRLSPNERTVQDMETIGWRIVHSRQIAVGHAAQVSTDLGLFTVALFQRPVR